MMVMLESDSPFSPCSPLSPTAASPSLASSIPDFLEFSPAAVVAVIVSFLDHRTRLNLPSRLTTDPMATRALDSDVDGEFLNFVFSEASDVEFERFLDAARPVHVNLRLGSFSDAEKTNVRLAVLLGRAKLSFRSISLAGQWKSSVISLLRGRISECRKYSLRDVLIDAEISLFPSCMPFVRQIVLDNVVFICDRKFLEENFRLPTAPRLDTLLLAVRPVCATLRALLEESRKFRPEILTLKFLNKKEDIVQMSEILKDKFPTLRSLEIDSLSLCDFTAGKFPDLESLVVISAAIVDERILKTDKFQTHKLKQVKLRLQASASEMIRKFFRIFRASEQLERISIAWNSEEDFLEELVLFRTRLQNFRFRIANNGMRLEAERMSHGDRRENFFEEFSHLIRCRCVQCRLEEIPDHTRLIADAMELPKEALAFYSPSCKFLCCKIKNAK